MFDGFRADKQTDELVMRCSKQTNNKPPLKQKRRTASFDLVLRFKLIFIRKQ